MLSSRLSTEGPKHLTHYIFGTTRNLLLGAGLCHTIQTEQYHHLPLVVLFPSVYAGYHLYKHKETLIRRLFDPPL
jgi:hypothetical protein